LSECPQRDLRLLPVFYHEFYPPKENNKTVNIRERIKHSLS